jgi:hypothetical protein
MIDTLTIGQELVSAQADLAAIATAISATEARLERARQADGELIALRDELGRQLAEAHATATAQTSTNAQADAALVRYHDILPEWQALSGPQPGQDAGAVVRESKKLEHLRELRRRATERVSQLEARQGAPAEPGATDLQARLARLKTMVR